MARVNISAAARLKYDKKTIEWGEKGAAHNIAHTPLTPDNRTTIQLGGVANNVAVNSTERQKQRTFGSG
jgi:hypothetical protein